MGSSASTPASSTANLSANDLLVYKINRQQLFKTTVAIAAVYGVIAILFLIIMLADTNNVSGLSKEYLPFTITFIGGMLVTMIILVAQILTFQPVSSKQPKVSDSICPDYYKLEATQSTDPDYSSTSLDPINKSYMGYKCKPDPAVYNLMLSSDGSNNIPQNSATIASNIFGHTVQSNIARVAVTADPTSTTSVQSVMATKVAPVYATSAGAGNLRCDVVYPQFMAYEDSQNFPQNPNNLRCNYSKVCNIPWTGVCPSPPS